jgi:hypothetical protein
MIDAMTETDDESKIKRAFSIVCSMKEASTAATDFATAIAMLTETIDQTDGVVIQRIAWTIKENIAIFETKRGELFHLLRQRDT